MTRRLFAGLLCLAAAAILASCGSSSSSSSTTPISPATAKAAIEHATGVKLKAMGVLSDMHDTGVRATYFHVGTTDHNNQNVLLIVSKDAAALKTAHKVIAELGRETDPAGPTVLLTHNNVAVLYENAGPGTDHTKDVKAAVNKL